MKPKTMTSAEVREQILKALELDLLGPMGEVSPYESERLDQAPSQWYLTGFIVPRNLRVSRDLGISPAQQQSFNLQADLEQEDEDDDELDQATTDRPARADDTDKETPRSSGKPKYLPSSLGLTVLVPKSCQKLQVFATWGDYEPVMPGDVLVADDESHMDEDTPRFDPLIAGEQQGMLEGIGGMVADQEARRSRQPDWQRTPKTSRRIIEVDSGADKLREVDLPGSDGLKLAWICRETPAQSLDPSVALDGAITVSAFLINDRQAVTGPGKEQTYAFQAELKLMCVEGFVARPGLSGLMSKDEDLRIGDLQYRDVFEFAVGHNASATGMVFGPKCHIVSTAWLPTATVELVEAAQITNVELRMEALASLNDHASAISALLPLATEYEKWIREQRGANYGFAERGEIAETLMDRAEEVARRIREGVELLKDEKVFTAFKIANRAMAMQARQRAAQTRNVKPESVDAPRWRPFQLAFLLLNLEGVVEPHSDDRKIVELLFFPTGGGKTEAYLVLAAFTLVYRRFREGVSGAVPKYAGVTVLMRYTLRLLTLDQMGRAAALICALELIRKDDLAKLGKWPFEIGLWVGAAATPNYMGKRGDEKSMVYRVAAYKNGNDSRRPIPMEKCPWCGKDFEKESFVLEPSMDDADNLHIHCMSETCAFGGDNHLPLLMVDEPIYRRLPCFLIATVDKYASMPWRGEIASLFGKVQSFERNRGFVGWSGNHKSQPIEMDFDLPPPELIIQDELHLISGPLGTIAGLFETAIEALATRDGVVPKIVSSTATVRRAKSQIGSLFGRSDVTIFPPPGPDRTDSFFAKTVKGRETSRLYVGVAAQGRSVKRVVLRTYVALMSATYKIYKDCGGANNKENPADPYMTMLGYFNSLRELGGTRRLVEDELTSQLGQYDNRKRVDDDSSPFISRSIQFEVQELTSRVTTDKISAAKEALSRPHMDDKTSVDISLATNMISVGLDITRLGLMAVYAQPKMTSEYIQATSRVGRDRNKPGMVLTIFNINRARDRSHYERFGFYHDTFYTGVEATSVTPFSPRALDRALFPVVVALARLSFDFMNQDQDAIEIIKHRSRLDTILDIIETRVRKVVSLNPDSMSELDVDRVKSAAKSLLDSWLMYAEELENDNCKLSYRDGDGTIRKRLIHDVLDPKLQYLPKLEYRKFVAGRSMRDVEHTVALLPKYFGHNSQFVKVSGAKNTFSYIRQSQLVSTYGPGAMVDLPWFATVVSGLDFWKKGELIAEPRLLRKVQMSGKQVSAFYTPKAYVEPENNQPPEGVVVWRFPGWSLTQKTRQSVDPRTGRTYQSRLLVQPSWIDRSNGKADLPDWDRNGHNKEYDIVPIRFIRACQAGHMDDIEWHNFLHGDNKSCLGRLWLDEMGTSGELTELRVRCDGGCNQIRWLSEAAGPNNPALGKCNGQQKWLGPEFEQQDCDKTMRLLIRTASNAYFPLKVSVISMPDRDELFRTAIDACWESVLKNITNRDELVFALRMMTEIKAKLEMYSIDEIWSEIEARRSKQATGGNANTPDNIRTPELKLLTSPAKYLGEDGLDSPFYAEAVDISESEKKPYMDLIERVVMIHRLREVTALVGYSRFDYISQDNDDDLPSDAEMAALGKNTDWLPAVENRGEGIFIQLNKQQVEHWASLPEVQAATQSFNEGVAIYNDEHQSNRKFRGPEFVLLHTLSHLLMNSISLECGYPSASIKERIYNDKEVGYGIMLYTASSDSHGTLGGLALAAKSIDVYLKKALELGTKCSNDPICSLHRPEDPNDKRHFQGAACHSCVFISETSCECLNDFLDRNLVVRTISGSEQHYFTID